MHAVMPSAGPETGGTVVTVIGVGLSTDLAPGLSCRIDGTPVEAKLLGGESNAESASCRVPPGAAGFVGVMFAVYNATGSGNAGGGVFQYQAVAHVSAVMPPLSSGGEPISLEGANMFSAAQVFIGGVQTQATIVSSRLALAETPDGLGAGRFSVTATNGGLEGGGSNSFEPGAFAADATSSFFVRRVGPPAVVAPGVILEEGGTVLTLNSEEADVAGSTLRCTLPTGVVKVAARPGAVLGTVECVSPALAPGSESIIVALNPSGAVGSVTSAPRGPIDAWERTSVLVVRAQKLATASPEVSSAASGGKASLLSGLLLVTGSALEMNALPRPQCIVGSSSGAAKPDIVPQWKGVTASAAAAELGPLGVLCFSPPPPETGFVPIRVGGYRSSESLRAAGQLLVVEPAILDSWATSPLLPYSANGGELHVVDVVGAGIWGPHPARGISTSIRFVLSSTPMQSFVGDADADGIGEWEIQSSGEAMGFSVGEACEWVSTALVRCEAPNAGPGAAGGAVGVALELQTLHPLTHTGKVSAARTTEVSAPALDVRPTLGSVTPGRGGFMGGGAVRLTGAGLGSDVGLRCRFAAVTVSLRPMLSEGSLDAVSAECLPPARPAGTIEVALQIQGWVLQTLVQNEQWPHPVFLYTAVDVPNVVRLDEHDGLVAIIGSGFPLGAQGFCSFKRSTSTLEVLSESQAVCNTPAHLLTAFSHVQLEQPLQVRVPGESPFFVIQARTPDPLQLYPQSACRGGGTLFFVEGTDILNYQDLDGPWCHVGAFVHRSHKVSSTLSICEMPALSDQGRRAVLELSNDLHVLSHGGLPFTLHSPAAFSVATRIALESGGTAVDIEGIRLGSELLQCQIGTTKLDGRILSENSASCVAPAHIPAAVPLRLSRNHRDFALGAGNLTYHDLNEAEFTLPPVGQVFGGQSVYLYLEGPILHDRLPMCLFGDSLEEQSVSTDAFSPHGGEILHCLSPPLTAGFAALELAFDFFQFTATGSQFMFQSPPTVDLLQPVSILSEGGTVVYIRGLNFIGFTECNFNEEVFGRVVFISSTLIICEAPATGTGEVSLEIRTESSAVLLNQMMVSVAGVPLEGLSGTQGSVQGGIFVSVYGNFLENQQTTCKFGTVGPISSRQVGADYISCLSPAHAPATVPVEVSINRYDYSLDGLAFQYLESFDILVSDVVHPMTSGGLIYVTSDEHIGFDSLSCSIDETHVHTEIDGTGVKCMTPSVASGFASLTLTHETIKVADGGSIQFVVPARILDLFPDVVTTGGGTVVSVPGQNLVDLDGVFFNFGGSLVSMHPISSALGLCEVPAQNEGSVPVSVQQSSNMASSPSDASIGYVYGAETYGVSPSSGLASGGAVVSHSVSPGSGFEPLHGTMGTLTYVSCRWLSLEALECVAPAHAPGIIPASAMLDGNRPAGGVAFRFVREGGPSVVAPDNAPATGGEVVSVVGSELDSAYGCMFGSAVGTLDIVNSQHILCGVPSLSGGFHELTILHSRTETLPGSLDFLITSHSFVAAALPNAGPYFGGTPVAVVGSEFLEGGHECIFGDMSSPPSHYVSSSLVMCVSPPYTGSHFFSKAAVDFALGPAGAPREQYGGTFSYFQQPEVTAFQPVSGLSDGGSTITLAGSNFTDSPDLSCKFGTISGTSAVFYDDSEIVCRAPAHAPSTYNASTGVCANPATGSCHVVPLEVTMNDRDYTFFNHTFNYLPTEADSGSGGGGGGGGGGDGGTGSSGTQIEGISIQGVPVTGSTILYIVGQNIQPLGIGCKFSTTQTPATVLSSEEVLCPTPPLEAGFAAFELILFGDLLTQTNLQVLFYTRPKVERALPGIISDAGSTLVSVYGEDFADGNSFPQGTQITKTYCMLGALKPSEAHFVSSSMIVCEALGQYPTFLGMHVSSNGIDWSNDEVYVELEEMPELSAISPFIGQEFGGEAVMLYVRGVSERREVVVSVGTIKGIHIRSIDEHAVHIMMPSHAPRTVPVLLGSNFNDVGIYGLTYQFMETPSLDFFIPERSTVHGGVQVQVQGSYFSQSLSHTCLFSESASPSTVMSQTSLFCITAEMSPGFHSFRIARAEPGPLQLETVIPPESLAIDNEKVSYLGGSVLAVSGMFFRPGNLCYFGLSARRSLFVSSALVKCETPESVYSNLNLDVTPEFQVQAATVSLNLHMVETTYIASVYPHEALHAGGQKITVNQVLSSGDSQGLQIGTIGPLAVQRVSEFSVECVSPAHASGAVPVSMTPNSRDFAVSMVNLVYTYEVKIDAVYPEVGPLTGGVTVIVTGSGFAADSITCRFGVLTVQGVARSSEEVRCITPAHPPGTVHVEVSLEGWGTSGQEAKGLGAYTFQVLPSVRTIQPLSSPATGGGVIHVLGADFSSDSLCWIGPDASSAHHVSSALVACEVDAQREGLAQVEIATRYIPSGMRAGQAAVLETYAAIAVTAVTPSGGVFAGGDTVKIHGGPMPGYLPDLSLGCCMGTVGPMSAKWVSDSSVECVSPAHVPRSVPVAVTANGRDALAAEVHFVYSVGVEVDDVYPDVGPVTGGASVLVVGSGFTSESTACRFGIEVTEGTVLDHGSFLCNLPAVSSGHIPLSVESSHGRTLNMAGAVDFAVESHSSIHLVFPSPTISGYSEPSSLQGINFGRSSLCFVGEDTAERHLVSSALMKCVFPNVLSDALLVSVGLQHSTLSDSISVPLGKSTAALAIVPATGPAEGGSEVLASGYGFIQDEALSCKFGTIGPVAGRYSSFENMHCITPGHISGVVPFTISANRGQFFSEGLFFEFQENLAVTGVVPRSGLDMGSTPVFVMGTNFVNSISLSCVFGKEIVQATFLTSTSLMCVSPPQPVSNVFLEVSNNGEDFTSDRFIFGYEICPPGSYCPDGEILSCPRGTYCPGTGNHNFTTCPPGLYQPYTGQENCIPSPVGFIAPDFGMEIVRPCPRGAVCDITGLVSWEKQCPPGHFCLEGTRTTNFTDFTVAERPLPCPFGYYCGPGVVADQTIANNFSTPQPCHPGYLCEPGSVTPQGSGPCPPGHYCPPGEMLPCPPRTFCSDVANTEPRPCQPGSYNQEYGQSKCKESPVGTISPGFARLLPEKCPPGFVCDEPGLSLPMKRCPRGHFCLGNAVTTDPLAGLDEPKIKRLSPIFLDPDLFRPKPCLPSTFCMEGVLSNVTRQGDFNFPQLCKEGSYCEWGTSDKTSESQGTDISNAMLPCPSGHYCPEGTYIPIPSPRGSFARGTGNSQPALCLPGSYTHYEGFEVCLASPAGFEAQRDGTFKPSICGPGTYRSLRDSITCKNCPMGTWSPFTGLTEQSLCVPCNPGIVCGVEGMQNNKPFGDNVAQVTNDNIKLCESGDPDCYLVELQQLGKATLCPEGYVCDARTSVATQKCPDGFFCGYGTTAESQFMNPCPPGYYCPEGSAASSRFQFPCLRCHFCELGTGVILPRCPEGTESEALSNNIDQCTADGITFWQIQPLRNELIDLTVAKSQSATDEEALEGEETETSSARKLQQAGGAFGSLLGLGGEIALDAESNSTSQDSNVDPFQHLAGCKAEGFEILNPQLVYTVNETGGNSVAVDAEGRPLIKYTLPRYYTARLTFDFRNISADISYGEHFEVSIFSGDRKVDKTLCEVGTPEHKRVPCAPWDEGDLINWNTMGEIQSRLYEDKCPPSTESTELPFWFVQRKERLSDGEKVDKHNIMELSVLALEDITFRVEVRMLHGLYQLQTRSGFLDTLCIDAIGPERASTVPDQQFSVVMRRNDDLMLPLNVPQWETVHRSIQLGYATCTDDNLHPSCRQNAHNMLISYNASRSSEGSPLMHAQGSPEIVEQLSENAARRALLQRQYQRSYRNMQSSSRATRRLMSMIEEGSSGMSRRLMASDDTSGASGPVDISTLTEAELEALLVPDVTEMQEDMLQDATIYWKSERSILAMTYLPYLSACRGFDSYMHFSQLIETPFMSSESGNYGKCSFVDPEETIFVSQWAPQAPPPDSDECELSFTCFYEENIQEAAAVTRWYELEGDTVFYLSTDPEDMDQVYEASIMATDDSEPPLDTSRYDNLITTQEMIAVSMGPADDGIQVQKNTVPKKLDFTVEYFQRSKMDKRIITAAIGFDEYLPAKKHDGEYTLSFTLTALNFFNLLNAFAFNNLFYLMLFVGIGGFAVAITVIFWLFNRIFTRLRFPPKFRFLPYLRIITTPPLVGTCLAMIPFLIGQRTIRAMIVSTAFFDALPTDLDNLGKTITDDELTKGQNGRMAVCFMIVSLFMLWSCSRIMIPKRNAVLEIGEDEDEEVFSQEEWKRSHFIIANLAINAVNVALIEFSFTAMYGQIFFVCFLLMKVLHIIIEMMQESFLKEALLCTPASVCLSMTAGLVTIAADDFTDFTLGFFLELFIGLGEYVFLDSGIAFVSAQWPKLTNAISQMVMKRRGAGEIVQLEAEEEESSLEDLMGFLTGYGVSTSSLILTPFFLYFYFDFNPQLQLSFLFGIRQKDLLIYLLFAGVIVLFQFIMDVILFNTQELFHGWKVYEYMKYARYRFNNRSARWKGMELHFDESISAELRTVDQMCFSSQFYFLLGLGGAGSFLFVLSIEMMLRVNYNMFKDPCFLLLIGIVTGGCILVQNLSLFVADVTGVWKVTGTRGFGDNIVPETEDLPFDINVFREGTDRDSSRREGLGGEFSLDDITSDSFRHKFLEHNRTWVLDQLSNMLTPRTAKRLQRTIRSGGKFRGGGLSDDDSDEGEPVEFGQIDLSFSSTHIIRSWLAQARQRAPGRFKRYLSQLSESGSSESEAEHAKFPPVRVSPFARSLVSGWLQTARQNLRSGGQRRMLSDSSDDSATSGSSSDEEGLRKRFGDVRVRPKSRSILNTWLQRARTTMGSSTKHQELLSSSGSSESDDSDLDGARWGKAIIKPASSSILRKWLEAARVRGPRPGARGGRLQTSRSSYISSDSESSDDDFLPKSEQRLPHPALKPNSLRVLRWWLQKVREQ